MQSWAFMRSNQVGPALFLTCTWLAVFRGSLQRQLSLTSARKSNIRARISCHGRGSSDRTPRHKLLHKQQDISRLRPRPLDSTRSWGGRASGGKQHGRHGIELTRADGAAGGMPRSTNWSRNMEIQEALWKRVFDKPEEWLDFRSLKRTGEAGPGCADFRCPSTGEEVWLNSFFLPHWVTAKLDSAGARTASWRAAGAEELAEEAWLRLLQEPAGWLDYRALKASGRLDASHADFVEGRSGQELCLADPIMPDRVKAALCAGAEGAQPPRWRVAGDTRLEVWRQLFEEPAKWLDFRGLKEAGKAVPALPDFRHRWTGEAVWVEELPSWATGRLRAAAAGGAPPWPEATEPATA